MGLAVLSGWIERLPWWLRPLDRIPGIVWVAAVGVVVVTVHAFDEIAPGFGAGDKWATRLMYGLLALALVVPEADRPAATRLRSPRRPGRCR